MDAGSTSSFCSAESGEGMVMYMEGFRFSLAGDLPCLNLFFASWTLNSVWKFLGAMIGVFLLAVTVEGISKFRQVFVRTARIQSYNAATVRSAVIVLHGVQALLGYLVMLVTMTYSAELLIMTVVGLAAGYAIFFSVEDDLEAIHVTTNPCCNFMLEEAKEAPFGTTSTTLTEQQLQQHQQSQAHELPSSSHGESLLVISECCRTDDHDTNNNNNNTLRVNGSSSLTRRADVP